MPHEILPLDERKRLRAKKLKKHGLANILTHWFNVAVWFMLLPTGLAILANPNLRLMPQGYIDFFTRLFGGVGNLVQAHATIGLIWLFVLTYNVLLGLRRYFVPFARKRMLLTPDDLTWFREYGKKLLGRPYHLPPQDAYNAGQKAYGYIVIIGTLGIAATGLIMTFSALLPLELHGLLPWLRLIHFGSVGMIVIGLVVHVYMAAFFPEEKSAFFSMFTGEVDALYARLHHQKWYAEKVQEELAYETRVLQEEVNAQATSAETA